MDEIGILARRRIKATVCYEGTRYRGFQLQPGGITVQSAMEESLGRLFREPVRVRAASRTDAGVHAREQVVDFSVPEMRSPDVIVRGGNALLPPDIRILAAEEAPPSFDARRHAKSKEYRYFLYSAPVGSPFFARHAWHVKVPLDLGAMRAGLACIAGRHDFSSFRGQGCTAQTTVREIFRAGIGEEAVPGLYSIGIAGDGFLRHMVRNIVGTILDVGRGRTSPDRVPGILERRDRRQAGVTAPAHGLFLWEVSYREAAREFPLTPGPGYY